MAVPGSGSGALSLAKIRNEIEENNYNHSLYGYTSSSTSLANLSNGSIDTINTNNASADRPDGSAPHAMSEFFDYDHDKAAAFSWTSPSGGISYAPTAAFNIEEENREGNEAKARTRINITWNSNGTHTTSYTDDANEYPGDVVSGAGTNAGGNIVTSTNTVSILEARFVFVDVDVDFQSATSNEKVGITYIPGGSIATTNVTVRNNTQNDATDLDFTDSWRTITPAVMGGSGSNTQTFDVFTQASSTSANGDGCVISTSDDTNDYIGLEIRANGSGGPTMLLRSSLSTGVDIDSYSREIPDFTCIMPDMIVLEESKGYIRIGDIVVGDRIYAKGDLNDSTADGIYAEVTEARTHTRSGYWNVEGLHITNDHPVWLTDESTSAWVKVEDIRPDVNRTYVAGTVDPVYLGTTPGHYYVYTDNAKFTVSGNYAPTTE